MTISDFVVWAKTNGLEILLITLGGILLARFVHWASTKAERQMSAVAITQFKDDLFRSDQTKYAHAAIQALSWVIRSVIYFVMGILILIRLSIPITSLVAPATVFGVALGFGAQRIVQDLLAGFFIFTERQYGVGDVIRISQPGSSTGVAGTVEELTLRLTKLRTLSGEVISISNGQILQVANLSKDWSQVVIDIQIPIEKSVETAKGILHGGCTKFASDPAWSPLLLTEPEVTGVEAVSIGYFQLRVIVRTLPSRQWEVARELRQRLLAELSDAQLLPASASASFIQQVV